MWNKNNNFTYFCEISKWIFTYKNKAQKIKVVFIYKNNLTNSKKKLIIYLGDIYVKKRDVFKKN